VSTQLNKARAACRILHSLPSRPLKKLSNFSKLFSQSMTTRFINSTKQLVVAPSRIQLLSCCSLSLAEFETGLS
jgi:hypothetical protein